MKIKRKEVGEQNKLLKKKTKTGNRERTVE